MNIFCVLSCPLHCEDRIGCRKSPQIWRSSFPPDLTRASHLVKAPISTYLFLKSKSCGGCAARQAALFSLSPWNVFLFPSLLPTPSLVLAGSHSICLLLFLLFWLSFLFFLASQVGGDEESACGQLSTCVHRWVVGHANPVFGTCCCCQCPAFAQYLPPDGGGGHAEGQQPDFGLLSVQCCTRPEI